MEDLRYAIAAVLATFGFFAIILTLAALILRIVAHWKIFEKAGVEGWKSLIPIYCEYTLFKIVWDSNNFLIYVCTGIAYGILSGISSAVVQSDGSAIVASLLGILSFVAFIAYLVWSVRVQLKTAASFGKETAFGVGLILLPTIFRCILAFGQSRFQGRTNKY